MKTGEGKTLVATLPAYLNALAGKGVHIVTVNDYLATPRQRVDGQGLPLPRPDRSGLIVHELYNAEPDAKPCTTPTSPTVRTTSSASTTCATTWSSTRNNKVQRGTCFRHRRRGGLHPHRRSAYPADYFRPGGQVHRRCTSIADRFAQTPQVVRVKEPTWTPRRSSDESSTRDYIVDEKARTATLTPARRQAKAEAYFHVNNLTDPREHHAAAPHQPGDQGARRHARAMSTMWCKDGRSHHCRRVHRPPDVRPPLQRGPAPGDRGQGGRQGPAREQDARHHHLPELSSACTTSCPA